MALRDLEDAGLTCWYAPRDVPPGGDWAGEIILGVRRAKALLVIVSASSADSSHVQRELQVAIDAKVPIYWLKLSDEFPDALRYELTSTSGIEWEHRDEAPQAMLDALVAADEQADELDGREALRRTPWAVGVGVGLWWALLYCVLVLFTAKGGPKPGDWWIGPAFAAMFVTIWVHFLAIRPED